MELFSNPGSHNNLRVFNLHKKNARIQWAIDYPSEVEKNNKDFSSGGIEQLK